MRLQKIVAAVRDTPGGLAALEAGAELAAASGGGFTALTILSDPWDKAEPKALAGHRHAVRFGVPSVEIARWAEMEHADLIVLGHDAGPLRPAIDGTLRRARVPCLVVTPGTHRPRLVAAAVDASPDASDVLQGAFAVGRVYGAEAVALHVEPGAPEMSWSRRRTRHDAEQVAAAVASAWEGGDRGGNTAVAPCDVVVRQGDPATEILVAAEEDALDLIVLGQDHGHAHGLAARIAPRLLALPGRALLTIPLR
ncbi:MAG TPA: universal stress protein [Gemmatimonadales bacterium]|nr:universal stress protein [Gemmatimonadales bacterium]